MTEIDYTPLYQHEDKLVSIRIGKPEQKSGAFIAIDGNIQFGFMDEQFNQHLIPLLECIINERTEGIYRFYKCKGDNYRFQSRALMLLLSNETGLALQHHAKEILNLYKNPSK